MTTDVILNLIKRDV